jgi:hypothetical protein
MQMRRVWSWFLGIAFGLAAGGAALVAGVVALLLLVPAVVWAAREKARPLGLGGLFIGLGAGIVGLIALANARCAASNVSGPNYAFGCTAPDLTGFYVAGAVLAGIGIATSSLAIARNIKQA